MPPKRDKTTGLPLPSPVVPLTNVCLTMTIPNAPEYKQALRGVLSDLGKYWTWKQTVGQDNTNAQTAAELWRAAAQTIQYQDECGGSMSCEDVADCIETNAATQNAIREIVGSSVPIPVTYPLGVPNPSPGINLAAGTNPSCNLDILWAQCLAVTIETHKAILDVLQKIEATTNSVELADAASEFPIVGWAKDFAGVQVALDLILYYQEALDEQYQAQYTETPGGVQDTLACALFCACKADCEITLDRIYNLYKTRVENFFAVPTLDTIVDLINFVAGISQDTTFVVDLAFFFTWGGAKLGSFFFGGVFDTTLQLLLALSVNDANNDWELLCTDCPPEPIENCWNFTSGKNTWEIIYGGTNPAFGTWTPGGFTPGSGGLIVEKAITDPVVTVIATYSAPVANVVVRALAPGGFYAMSNISTTLQTVHTMPIVLGSGTDGIGIWVGNADITTQKLINVCVEIAPP